jgi:uncharacterized protein YbjQ (UPF0145 family)
MKIGLAVASLLASLSISASAAEPHFILSKLLQSESVKEFMVPEVKLYWGNQETPAFAEIARPDVYTRSSISHFGGTDKHCVEAFEKSLEGLIEDARTRGYDAIIHIQVLHKGKPSEDPAGFSCEPGFATTEVPLQASFAMTQAAFQKAAELDRRTSSLPSRNPAKGAIFLPIEPIMASPEAKAILGPDLSAHWGVKAPTYIHRYGPEEYSEEADRKGLENEAACRMAVLNTLSSMAQDAKERHFDAIIKIRSHLEGKFAPTAGDVECQIDKKTVSVTLQASLASTK